MSSCGHWGEHVFPLKGGARCISGESCVQAEGPDTASCASGGQDGQDKLATGSRSKLVQVLIEPFGLLRVAASDSIAAVQDYCSARFFGGKAEITLRINMWQPPLEATIVMVQGYGVLRAFTFPLKGGALTVSAAEEVVQNQLVAHGATLPHAKSTADHLLQTAGLTAVKKARQLKTLASQCDIVIHCTGQIP